MLYENVVVSPLNFNKQKTERNKIFEYADEGIFEEWRKEWGCKECFVLNKMLNCIKEF
jgi:hypothetical protein